MAKIIVSGYSGFVGKSLVSVLAESGHELTLINSNSGNVADMNFWLSLPSAEIVIHLAANTFVPESWNKPAEFINTNLMGTACALNYCKIHKAKIIFLSSYLYGNPSHLPIDELATTIATNPYALSKKMAEELCLFFSENYNIKVVVLRPFNIYGPGQKDSFLIPTIIGQLLYEDSVRVKDLAPKRDYVYIDDLVKAIVLAMDSDTKFSLYNIGYGKSYSVLDIINLLQKLLKTNLPVLSDNLTRQGEIMDTVADCTKAHKELGWKPAWSLEKGLEEIIKQFKAGKNND